MGTIVAIVAFIAFERYALLAKDARVLRLRVISEHFMTAAVNLRIEYLLSNAVGTRSPVRGLMVDGKLVYLSEQGWPASTITPVSASFHPDDSECFELWRILLQNPSPIALGQYGNAEEDYKTFALGTGCRYSLKDGEFYFDYFPNTGKIELSR